MLYRPVRFSRALILAGVLSATAAAVSATPVIINWSGVINTVNPPYDVFGPSVQIGTPYSASLRMDSSAAGDLEGFSSQGYDYVENDHFAGFSISFGNFDLSPTGYHGPVGITGIVSPGWDQIRASGTNTLGSGLTDTYTEIDLDDFSGTALAQKGFPLTGPGLNDASRWDNRVMQLMATNVANGHRSEWLGTVDCISTAVVPEPATCMLLISGLATVPLLGRRKR